MAENHTALWPNVELSDLHTSLSELETAIHIAASTKRRTSRTGRSHNVLSVEAAKENVWQDMRACLQSPMNRLPRRVSRSTSNSEKPAQNLHRVLTEALETFEYEDVSKERREKIKKTIEKQLILLIEELDPVHPLVRGKQSERKCEDAEPMDAQTDRRTSLRLKEINQRSLKRAGIEDEILEDVSELSQDGLSSGEEDAQSSDSDIIRSDDDDDGDDGGL